MLKYHLYLIGYDRSPNENKRRQNSRTKNDPVLEIFYLPHHKLTQKARGKQHEAGDTKIQQGPINLSGEPHRC
jgi:hypothetical protein